MTSSVWYPTLSSDPEDGSAARTLGTVVRPKIDGYISHIAWQKSVNDGATEHIGVLYAIDGTELARSDSLIGVGGEWNLAELPTPVTVLANTQYLVGLWSNANSAIGYSQSVVTDVGDGDIEAVAWNNATGGNGRYSESNIGEPSFPENAFNEYSWKIDCIFVPASGDITYVTIRCIDANTLDPIEGARIFATAAAGGGMTEGEELANAATDANGEAVFNISIALNQPIVGHSRKGTATPYYKQGTISATITPGGDVTLVVPMAKDE